MNNRDWTVEEKTIIVLETLRGKISLDEICRRYQVSINEVYHWCNLFLVGAKETLVSNPGKKIITKK